jgi:site-specific DNA-methyltransferase (cytosine-N4-specific)
MPLELAEFFIQFLTETGDTVLDPFAGSNTTGEAAEKLNRNWLAIEADKGYIHGSLGRFNGNFELFEQASLVEDANGPYLRE